MHHSIFQMALDATPVSELLARIGSEVSCTIGMFHHGSDSGDWAVQGNDKPELLDPLARQIIRSNASRCDAETADGRNVVLYCHPVKVRQRILGHVVVVVEPENDTPPFELLAEASTAIGIQLMQRIGDRQDKERRIHSFVSDLLLGRHRDIGERMRCIGFHPEQLHRVCVIEAAGFSQPLDSLQREDLHNRLPGVMSSMGLGRWMTEHGGLYVLLMPDETQGRPRVQAEPGPIAPSNLQGRDNPSIREVVRQLQKVISLLEPALPGIRLTAGISRQCRRLQDYPLRFEQAVLTLTLGSSLAPRQSVHVYDDLGVYRLLAHFFREWRQKIFDRFGRVGENDAPLDVHATLLRFGQEVLRDLWQTEDAKNRELFETLHVFFQNNCNYELASGQLFIHPNTVRYRLRNAQAITRYSFQNPEDLFALQLAVKIKILSQGGPSEPSKTAPCVRFPAHSGRQSLFG